MEIRLLNVGDKINAFTANTLDLVRVLEIVRVTNTQAITAEGIKFKRDSMKYGFMWRIGVTIQESNERYELIKDTTPLTEIDTKVKSQMEKPFVIRKKITKEFKNSDIDLVCTLTLQPMPSVNNNSYLATIKYNFPKAKLKTYEPSANVLKQKAIEYITEFSAEYKVETRF